MKFSKLHGLGNDFIVITELEKEKIKNKKEFSEKQCKRNFSVGADGVLFLCPSQKSDFKMRIFNSDGSEAENCVNGLRCAVLEKFLLDGKKQKEYSVETLAGTAKAKILSFEKNSALIEITFLGKQEFKGKQYIEIGGKSFEYYFVDVGNPHAVVFLKEPVKDFSVEETGHAFECHEKFFPQRTNAEFVNLISPKHVKMRVHERGACETMACGSGSIAIVIAGIEAGVLEKDSWVKVEQPGGIIEINSGKELLLRAKAEKVFEGNLEVE